MGTEVTGLLVLKAKTSRAGDVKKYDIIRAEGVSNVDDALKDLAEGEYVVVDPGTLAKYNVSYRTVQDVTPVA